MIFKVEQKPFPIQIDESIAGMVISWMMCAKGVYFVYTQRRKLTDTSIFNCDGLFIVEESCPLSIISESVRTFGYKAGDLYFFDFHSGGIEIIAYEIARYRLGLKKRRSPRKKRRLINKAKNYCGTGSTVCPAFFGAPIPPEETPWGPVCRYITVDTGMWFLQTSIHTGGMWVFSVCNVLVSDVNDIVKNSGVAMTASPPFFGHEPVFWTMDNCAPAIWEYLYHLETENLNKYIISRETIKGYIASNNKDYAHWSNTLLNEEIETINDWITKYDDELSKNPTPNDELYLREERERKLKFKNELEDNLFFEASNPIREFLKPL